MNRIACIFLVLFIFLSPKLAHAKNIEIDFLSNVEKARVEIFLKNNPLEVIHSCLTPCSIKLKKKKKNSNLYNAVFYKEGYTTGTSTFNNSGYITTVSETLKAASQPWNLNSAHPNFKKNCRKPTGDHPALPCIRPISAYGALAPRSGHCKVEFFVDSHGIISQSNIIYCTEKVYIRPAVTNLQKWQYIPKTVEGKFVKSEKLTATLTYRLSDNQGRLISEPEKGQWYWPENPSGD